jgi:hypothetical protein
VLPFSGDSVTLKSRFGLVLEEMLSTAIIRATSTNVLALRELAASGASP